MRTLPKNISNKFSSELIENIYNYDLNEYKAIYDKVIYNFYWDIFQDIKVLDSKVIHKQCSEEFGGFWMNVIADGASDMQKIYIKKNKRDYANHISASLYVS